MDLRRLRNLFDGLAAPAWILGFIWLRKWGSLLPLFVMALVLAVALVAVDAETRRLLKPRPVTLAVGAVAGGVMIAATYLLYPLFARLWPPLGDEVRGLYQLLLRGHDRTALTGVVVTMSACEEIIFRGWLLTPRSTPRAQGAAAIQLGLATLFYASIHVMSASPLLVAVAFLCGLVWGLLRTLTDTLWASIVCHVAWDLAIMVIAPLG